LFEQKTVRQVEQLFHTDAKCGLSKEEAEKRLRKNGKNELEQTPKKTVLESFLEQVNDPLICVLLIAGFLSFLLREISDAIIIFVVVLVNAVVGMIQEGKAKKALDSLKKMTRPKAFVKRNGKRKEIQAEDLVVGDVVFLEAGFCVPADLRLTESFGLRVEESALTGESVPVEKDAGWMTEKELPVGDRKNQAFFSTFVTSGRGEGIVVAVGKETEIGKIASVLHDVPEELTPLQKKLAELGKILSLASVGICVALFLIAVFQKREILPMFLTAVSLAVAAVPEGLPAIVTIVLAMSVQNMVKNQVIIRRLPSVETLGAVNVVCSDKTGTLTQNKMEVCECYVNHTFLDEKIQGEALPMELLEAMVLCNDAVLGKNGEEGYGDPTELALLVRAGKAGVEKEETEKRLPRIREKAFDSKRKRMTTVHRGWKDFVTYTKGAPEAVFPCCSKIKTEGEIRPIRELDRIRIEHAVTRLSSRGLRILAFATKREGREVDEKNLIFLGMVGMKDPIRPEAKEAVEQFRNASVKTVMITGDHKETALAIAKELGIARSASECMTGEELDTMPKAKRKIRILQTTVFARVSPEHKMEIVRELKEAGNIVAMTGDGVNDAPSLTMADIGIAMGKNGTDVAKNAADMILADDNFATIEKAMEEGRSIYENIRKTILFLLSSNFGEIMTMFLAVVCGMAAPLKSSHILWINLITDSLPALALGIDPDDKKARMKEKPRNAGESLFANGGVSCTIFYGTLIAAISLLAYFLRPCQMLQWTQQKPTMENFRILFQDTAVLTRSQTYAFTVLGMSQLFHAIGMRDVRSSVFSRKRKKNPWMAVAFLLGFFLQFLVTELPALTKIFGTAALSVKEWFSLLVLSAFPVLAHEIFVLLFHEKKNKK
jgi:Ca2+-transporting ATPase